MPQRPKGFTIIELLVVIAVMVFIVTLTLVYGGNGRNYVSLSVSEAKIAGTILQAKQLAVATYSFGSNPTCGYGVYFDITNQEYSLFIYSPKSSQTTGICPSLLSIESSTWLWSPQDMVEYSAQAWNVPLPNGVTLKNLSSGKPSAQVVLFYPPNPATLSVFETGLTFQSTVTSYVNLATADGSASSSIAITPAGQVTF